MRCPLAQAPSGVAPAYLLLDGHKTRMKGNVGGKLIDRGSMKNLIHFSLIVRFCFTSSSSSIDLFVSNRSGREDELLLISSGLYSSH